MQSALYSESCSGFLVYECTPIGFTLQPLTFSGEESWSSPAFWSAPRSQHPQVHQVASSRSTLFQTPAVFGSGACDQQLIHQPESLPKPKKYTV